MSNTYNQQLGQALTAVGNSLQQSELTENNTMQSAKLSLYHAHGLTSKTEHQLTLDQRKGVTASEQNKVVSIGVTTTQNIVTASNAALLDASGTTSSASAAAASIQKSAAALTRLSGDVKRAFEIANSLDNGTKIERLVKKASRATHQAAVFAEEAGLIALGLTIEASQSRAANVVTQANTVKSNTVALQKSLSDTFAKLQELVATDMSAVSDAIKTESEQSGVYTTARAEDDALRLSEDFINRFINHNLACTIPPLQPGHPTGEGTKGDQFTLSFDAFNETEDNENIISEYRLILVKEDDAPIFTAEFAKSISNPANYVSIQPSGAASYSADYVTADYLAAHPGVDNKKYAARDYNGLPVTRGVPYTFFVYVVYTQAYESHYNDTNGLLSQPGPAFTLVTQLPVVDTANTSLIFYNENESNAVRVAFRVPAAVMKIGDVDLKQLMEFRTLLFSSRDKKAMALNLQIDAAAEELYVREQAYRMAEEKYQSDEQLYNAAVARAASEQEITSLKNQLTISKEQYQNARDQYNQQVQAVARLSQAKINDFRVDESILESVPRACYLVAKLNNDLPKELDQQIKTLEGELKGHQDEYTRNQGLLKEKNKSAKELTKKIDDLLKSEPGNTEIGNNSKALADKIAQLEALYASKVVIQTASDATALLAKLDSTQVQQVELLNEIIALFTTVSETEVKEIQLSAEINELRGKLKSINTDIVLLHSQQQMLKDQLDQLPLQIKQFNDQLHTIGAASEKYLYYEAVDTSGDFTDNYGEPLVDNTSYCALILSAIKDSEPDAAPLYQDRMSGFSPDAVFNPQA